MAEQVSSLRTGVKWKDTPIGKIPVDWEVVRLVDLCSISSGGALDYSKDVNAKPYPVYGSNGMLGSSDTYNFSDGFVIGRVGASGTIQVISFPVWASDNTLLLTITDSSAIKWFLYYYLQKCNLPALAMKTAQPLLTQQVLKLVLIAKPGIHEQERIAEILRTVDEEVDKTAQVIEKTREIKRGLMQQLLTRGIGHQRFKKSPIGEIPEEWELVRLKDVARHFLNGGTPDTKNKNYWDGNIPWITGADFEDQRIRQVRRYVTAEGVRNSATNVISKGNLLVVTRTGVGKVAIAPSDIAISQDIAGVLLDSEKASTRYIYWHLGHIANRLRTMIQGTSINGLLREDIESLAIPLPDLSEQKEIADILFSSDDEIEKETDHKRQLESLKQGLMQLLLTGKVRVSISS